MNTNLSIEQSDLSLLNSLDSSIDRITNSISKALLTTATKEASLLKTFRHMTSRKLIRIRNGHFRKQKQSYIWFVLMTLLVVAFSTIFVYKPERTYYVNTLFVLLVVLGIYLMTKLSQPLRFCLYWLLIAIILLEGVADANGMNNFTPLGLVIAVFFFFMEIATISYFLITWVVYPRLVYWECINAGAFWNITKVSSNYYSYTTFEFNHLLAKKRHFGYVGEVHPDTLEPHGLGIWKDDSLAGEFLYGYWEDGLPVGPFYSNEYGSGFCFYNLRIGFVLATADTWKAGTNIIPKPNPLGLSYGVAGVECSVSGKFYLELPSAELVSDSVTPQNEIKDNPVHWMLQFINLKVPDYDRRKFSTGESVLLELSCDGGISASGFVPLDTSKVGSSTKEITVYIEDNRLQLNGYKRIDEEYDEALIFFPGFNCPIDIGTCRLGQLIALANLPDRIKPFVFFWPAGCIITYHMAVVVAEGEKIVQDFRLFMNQLVSSKKFKKVHILAHSMGARAALNCASVFGEFFQIRNYRGSINGVVGCGGRSESDSCGSSSASTTNICYNTTTVATAAVEDSSDKLTLATFTMMNAEANLEKFIEVDYSIVRSFCNLLSIYADEDDFALSMAEIFSGQYMLGKYALKKFRRKQKKKWTMNDFIYEIQQRHDPLKAQRPVQQPEQQPEQPQQDLEDGGRIPQTRKRMFRRSNANLTYLTYDLDCIDTTNLDANVHDVRHMYFNLNKTVIDDYRDLIVLGKRAIERGNRLVNVERNVFTFLNAPSYVVNP